MNSKETIKNYFKLNGFIIEPKAIQYLLNLLKDMNSDKSKKILEKIISSVMDQQLPNNKISISNIEKAINISQKINNTFKLFQVIDSFDVPKLIFNNETRKFISEDNKDNSIFTKIITDHAESKSEILKNRYNIIYQRLIRDDLSPFRESMKPIEYLLSCGVVLKKVIVLAMLSQYKEGEWFLEDSTGIVSVDLENTNYHKGLVLEGCFVLAEGRYEDKVLVVNTIGMPPLEPPSLSRNAITNNTNYFGGFPINSSVKSCPDLEKVANVELSGKSLIFISELWIDKVEILEKLKILFHGYSSSKPSAFILCGDFLSPETNGLGMSEKIEILKRAIKSVVRQFTTFHDLALRSHLVFVAGPNDPFQGLRTVLPHPSLPESILLDGLFDSIPGFTSEECEKFKNRVILASNPCRITFYNKEIVVFREHFVQKLYRHCVHNPEEEEQSDTENTLNDSAMNTSLCEQHDEVVQLSNNSKRSNFLESKLCWTLISQAHLMPLPIHISPVFWGLDHTLQLFPTPDLVVISDPMVKSFEMSINGCMVLNPPNFSKGGNFPFKIYYPLRGEIQNCNLVIKN